MMSTPRALRQPLSLRLFSAAFLVFWCIIAAFPIFWIAVMSFKSPVDAFAASPWDVIFGPATRAKGNGLSVPDIILGLAVLFLPIYFGIHSLYEWSHADVVAADPILQKKSAYLNESFFTGRAVAYFESQKGHQPKDEGGHFHH